MSEPGMLDFFLWRLENPCNAMGLQSSALFAASQKLSGHTLREFYGESEAK